MRAYLIVALIFALFVSYHVFFKENSVVDRINATVEQLNKNLPN